VAGTGTALEPRTHRRRHQEQSRPVRPHCHHAEPTQDVRVEMLDQFQPDDGFVTLQTRVVLFDAP
jgi:hypothetical protein